ncbi:MAG: class I SAM-dependent methyltransferase [Actinomycetota bacterium]|nr:class I SAM-dependent methyltransferase [Actinomycetota bacterium]
MNLARSFGAEAARYALVRPSYPAEAIDFALENIEQPQRILDLGAGTGKLTRSLVGRARELVAVEPDPAMRAVLADYVPQAQALDGSAERIPLPDGSVDAVLAGQAFHWFARPDTDRELARVLRPGGVVGLIWNYPDPSVSWVPKIYQATRDRDSHRSAEFVQLDAELFTDPQENLSSWQHELPGPDGLIDLVHTWSWVITRTAAERAAIDRRLRVLVSQYAELQGPVVQFPQRTTVLRQYRR